MTSFWIIFNTDFYKSLCPKPQLIISAVWKTFKECPELGSMIKIKQTRFWFLLSSSWSSQNLTFFFPFLNLTVKNGFVEMVLLRKNNFPVLLPRIHSRGLSIFIKPRHAYNTRCFWGAIGSVVIEESRAIETTTGVNVVTGSRMEWPASLLGHFHGSRHGLLLLISTCP